jgi:hypothetical protein
MFVKRRDEGDCLPWLALADRGQPLKKILTPKIGEDIMEKSK